MSEAAEPAWLVEIRRRVQSGELTEQQAAGELLNAFAAGCAARRAEASRKRRHGRGPVLVGCWMCGRRARRVYYTIGAAVGRRTKVRVFGRCPRPGCDGSMHQERERLFVLRAALAWDRQGGNRTSEYDL